MKIARQIVVFDAADLATESAFWAGVLGGRVVVDDNWHSVVDADGQWRIGVQLAPNHTPPDWPHGTPQQVHLDLHVDDPASRQPPRRFAAGSRRAPQPPVLDVHAHLHPPDPGRSRPSARIREPPSRSRTTEAIVRASSTEPAAELDVNAIAAAAHPRSRRRPRMKRGGPSPRGSAGRQTPRQLVRPALTKNAAAARRSPP